jgi:hypothetical protein
MSRAGSYVLLLFFLCSCRAERFNPLDPESPNFRDQCTLTGSVVDWDGAAVAGARIDLAPGSYYGISDGSGQYEIEGVPTGIYSAVGVKDGFSAETLAAELAPGASAVLDFRLDNLPVFHEIRATTHNDSTTTGNDFYAIFFAAAHDSDGRTESLFVTVDSSESWKMTRLAGIDSFNLTLPDDSLPGGTLEYLTGKEIRILAFDDAGQSSCSDPLSISRIIYENPVARSPSGADPPNPVTFIWFTIRVAFDFTYTLTVQETWPTERLWIIEGLPPNSNNYFLPELLEQGYYLWSVKAVDTFGNTSRSQMEGFTLD